AALEGDASSPSPSSVAPEREVEDGTPVFPGPSLAPASQGLPPSLGEASPVSPFPDSPPVSVPNAPAPLPAPAPVPAPAQAHGGDAPDGAWRRWLPVSAAGLVAVGSLIAVLIWRSSGGGATASTAEAAASGAPVVTASP